MGVITARAKLGAGTTYAASPPSPPPPPNPADVLTPGDFTLLGGYKFPVDQVVNGRTLAFLKGGLFKDTGAGQYLTGAVYGEQLRFTIPGGGYGTQSNPQQWPLLTYDGNVAITGFVQTGQNPVDQRYAGVVKLPSGHYLSSSFSEYGTGIDLTDPCLHLDTGVNYTPGERQVFGGQMGPIPSVFVAANSALVGTKTWWLAGIVGHSGQGYPMGPSLLIFDPAAPGTSQKLIQFGYLGADRAHRSIRPPDYDNTIFGDDTMPVDGVGYWQADKTKAVCWTVNGLEIWGLRGTGPLDYVFQGETGSGTAVAMYGTVPTATLALSLAGSIGLHEGQVDPEWYDWPDITLNAFTQQVMGAWYDEATDQVHLVKKWGYHEPGYSEDFPIVQIWSRTAP